MDKFRQGAAEDRREADTRIREISEHMQTNLELHRKGNKALPEALQQQILKDRDEWCDGIRTLKERQAQIEGWQDRIAAE